MDTNTIIVQVQNKIGVAADGNPGPATFTALYKNIFNADPPSSDMATLIKAIQSKTGSPADGNAGPETWQAIYIYLFPQNTVTAGGTSSTVPLDSVSEKYIANLNPEVQDLARALVHKAADSGITIKVISGLRSYAEQDALYAQGRTAPGSIVTNARGGYSNHNFGLAFDVGVYENGVYQGDSPKYKTVGAMGKSLGLSWGGDWKSIQDEPHFELRPDWAKDLSESDMLAGLRQRKEQNAPLLA